MLYLTGVNGSSPSHHLRVRELRCTFTVAIGEIEAIDSRTIPAWCNPVKHYFPSGCCHGILRYGPGRRTPAYGALNKWEKNQHQKSSGFPHLCWIGELTVLMPLLTTCLPLVPCAGFVCLILNVDCFAIDHIPLLFAVTIILIVNRCSLFSHFFNKLFFDGQVNGFSWLLLQRGNRSNLV
jgi:hypothetical protein